MAVDLDNERDYSPESLREREKSKHLDDVGAKPISPGEQASLDQIEAGYDDDNEETSDDAQPSGDFNYRKEKTGKVRKLANGYKNSQKAGVLFGVGSVLVTFGLGLAALISGPAGIVAFGRLLEQIHFSSHTIWTDTSVGRMMTYARTVDGGRERRNMGFLGNTLADGFELRMARRGMKMSYNSSSRLTRIDIDTSTSAGRLAAEGFRQQGVPLTDLGNNTISIDMEGTSARDRRRAVAGMVNSMGMNKYTAAIARRNLKIRAGVDFHPLKNLARTGDEQLADFYTRYKDARAERIRNGVNSDGIRIPGVDEKTTNPDGTPREPTADGGQVSADTESLAGELKADANSGAATPELSSKLNSRLATRGSGAAGAVALVCGLQKIGDTIPDVKYANVILPLMRIGMEAITTSSQTSSNLAFNVDELGAASDALYDEETGSSAFSAASIQSNLGEPVTGEVLPDSARPDTGKPVFFRTLDSIIGTVPGGNQICDAVTTKTGGWLIDIASWATNSFGPVSFFAQALIDVATGQLVGVYMDDLIRWLVSRQVEDRPEGALYGNYADTGAFLSANDDCISSGCIELSSQEQAALKLEDQLYIQQEMQQRSFFARLFDAYDPNSMVARAVIMKPRFASVSSMANSLGTAPTSLLGNFSSSLSSVFGGKARAASNSWDYGVPKYGFSVEDIDDEEFENPYRVEEEAEIIGIEKLNKDYGQPCFGVTIDPTTYRLSFSEATKYDDLVDKEECKDRNNRELKIMRFYIHYLKTSKAMACMDADIDVSISSAACTEIGFNNAQSASLGSPSVLIQGDTSNIQCQAGTDDGVQVGYVDNKAINIRICVVGGIRVNSQISGNVQKLLDAASAVGVNLSGGGYRTMSEQQSLYNSAGSGTAARPGTSNHQMGFAIDFNCDGNLIPRRVSPGQNKCFDWLVSNAGSYGLFEWGKGNRTSSRYEAWHWSVDGD
ncbi:MAG: M15 family metallopeptidase [bacterium]|nr:M15 family metallopeptidase [bacterium]